MHQCNRMRGPLAMVLGTALALLSLGSHPARAGMLGQLRQSISALWQRKVVKQHEARAAYGHANTLSEQAAAVGDELEATQQELQNSTDTYYNYWRQMKQTEAQIEVTRQRVQIVTARYNTHKAMFGRRLAAMQRTGKLDYLEVFLGSHTLSDLTRRTYIFNTLTSHDSSLLSSLQRDRIELQQMQNLLMAQWAERNRLQLAANNQRVRIAGAEARQAGLLHEINSNRYAAVAYAREQQESSQEIGSMIYRLTERRNEVAQSYRQPEPHRSFFARFVPHLPWSRPRVQRVMYAPAPLAPRRRLLPQVNGEQFLPQELPPMSLSHLRPVPLSPSMFAPPITTPGGKLPPLSLEPGKALADTGWEQPVRGRLSSRYGMRFHPILHRYKLHTGDDLAAPMGAPFRAAHSGHVLWAGWKKAYGNTIVVDMGNGITTLYGHASKIGVHAGQQVKRGDYIGNVGSTGWSTGPHLHFEVRKNGQPIDPTPYLHGK